LHCGSGRLIDAGAHGNLRQVTDRVIAEKRRAMQGPGRHRGLKGLRVTPVRRGVREPLPLRRLSGRREGLGRGNRGGEKAVPTVGQDLGCLKSRGWRRAFTLRSYLHPCPPLPPPPPARPLPRWRDASGAGQGPGNDARDMRDRLGTARAHDPRRSRPASRNRLQAIALGAGRIGSEGGGDGADQARAGGGPGSDCRRVSRLTPDQT
jgi:hypothetical protein